MNWNLPLVSIVILNYNGSRHLIECIPSVLRTSYPSFDVVVVDNASSDDSLSTLARFSDNRIRIVESKSNLGFAEGNNLGLLNTKGTYIVFLNNDTKVEPNWLVELVNVMESDPVIGAAQSKLLLMNRPSHFDSSGDFIDRFGFPISRAQGCPDLNQYQELEEVFSGRGAALIVRKSALRGGSPFDGEFFLQYEDIDLCWRLRLLGYRIVYVPSSIVYHIGQGTSSPYRVFHARKNAILLLVKNYSLANIARYLPCHILINILELANDILHTDSIAVRTKIGAYAWLLVNLQRIIAKREEVQMSRILSDWNCMRLMLKTKFSECVSFTLALGKAGKNENRINALGNRYLQLGLQEKQNFR